MAGLMLHTGGYVTTLSDLDLVEVPKTTDSYCPVPHKQVIQLITETAQDNGFIVKNTEIALKDRKHGDQIQAGAKLFGLITLGSPNDGRIDGDELRTSIAFRSSYDKSISLSFAGGSSVFICDNMVMTGDLMTIRKHTPNVLMDAYKMIYELIDNVKDRFLVDRELRKILSEVMIPTDHGLDVLGSLASHGKLGYAGGSGSPFALAIREWTEPSFKEFGPRTAWSLYNACTYGLKRTRLDNVFEANINLTTNIIKRYAPTLVTEYEEIAV